MKYTLVVLLAVCMAVVIGAEIPGMSAEDDRPGMGAVARAMERTGDAAVGASIVHPEQLVVERERYTYDGTYGYTIWKPDPEGEEDVEGGDPQVRVALAYDLKPGQIEARIRERIAEHPDVKMEREAVRVGERKLKGSGVGPIPGSTPSTEIYVAEKGRVYQINVYGEELGAKGKELLSGLRFEEPSRSVSSNVLKDAKKAEIYQDRDGALPFEGERDARRDAAKKAASKATVGAPVEEGASSGPTFRTMATTPVYAEYQIYEGCWRADSRVYFQTQHSWGANPSPSDGLPTGFTKVGRPNYWGQYTHGNLGYGRCASTYYTNDKFAVDYPLNRGDAVFSPFYRGTVTFAGRNYSHKNYGIFVVIKDSNGRYVSISGHLNGLAAGIRRGAVVTTDTVIGYAGNTGDPSIPVGEVHMHQAFYRYPYFKTDGSPYGGRGLQAVYHRYIGRPGVRSGGVYQFVGVYTSQSTIAQKTQGEIISN